MFVLNTASPEKVGQKNRSSRKAFASSEMSE